MSATSQGSHHEGRNAKGQFEHGNRFQHQNAYARRTGELRKIMLECVNEMVLRQAMAKVIELANLNPWANISH